MKLSHWFVYLYVYAVQETKPRALNMLGTCSTTDQHAPSLALQFT